MISPIPIPAWRDMSAGEKLARTAHITDDIFRRLKLFNREGFGVAEYNDTATIVYKALEAAQTEQP